MPQAGFEPAIPSGHWIGPHKISRSFCIRDIFVLFIMQGNNVNSANNCTARIGEMHSPRTQCVWIPQTVRMQTLQYSVY
jgi:hypothetical protein